MISQTIGSLVDSVNSDLRDKAKPFINSLIADLQEYSSTIAELKAVVLAKEQLLEEKYNILKELQDLAQDETFNRSKDSKIKAQLEVLEKASEALDIAYIAANKAINALTMFVISNQSINMMMTLRSPITVGPNIVNSIPFGTGQSNAFDPSKVDKAIASIMDKIEIPEELYVAPHETFKPMADNYFRLVHSIQRVIALVKPFLKFTEEPLPMYNDLRFTNPNFVIWSSTKWGPTASKFFGLI